MVHNFIISFRHAWLVFTAETKRLVTYRAQFWFELILSSVVEVFVTLAVWKTIFNSSSNSQIGTYTFESMALYIVVAIFFSQATKGTGVGTFQREVYEGSLTKYLIYPLSVYSYKFGTFIPRALFAVIQMLIAIVLIWTLGYWPDNFSLSLGWVCCGFSSVFLAALLYFYMIICLESLAFWVDHVWALSYALQISTIFLSGKAIPLELFPNWLRIILEISPFQFLAYFPAKVFLGQLSLMQFTFGFSLLIFWTIAIYLLSKLVMQRGLYNYTGVGQ